MAHTCSECTYLDLDKEYDTGDGRFWCETKYEWHYADEAECWRYCTAYSRSSKTAESYKNYSRDKQSSGGCFITTIVCEILGLKDDDKVLKSLRSFRDNKMQKEARYRNLLAQYDIVGPIISNKIREDKLRDTLAVALFQTSIKKVSEFIENKEYLNAVKLYSEMTEGLIEYYNINRKVTIKELNEMDVKKSGHGNFQKKFC